MYIAPNNCFAKYCIIGILLPLIKIQTKPFQNSKHVVWSASKLNKLSSNTIFIIFGIYWGPQLNTLLQCLNQIQKIEYEKDWNKRKEKRPGGSEQNVPGRPWPRSVATPRHGRCSSELLPLDPLAPVPSPERIRRATASASFSPRFPSSPCPPSLAIPPRARNPSYGAAADCRRSTEPLTHRRHLQLRRDHLYRLAEARLPGSSTSPGIRGIPRAPHRA